MQETGPAVYHPYLRALERLTICRCPKNRHHILLSYSKSLSVSPVWGLNSVEPCPALYNTLFTTNTKVSIRYLLEIG